MQNIYVIQLQRNELGIWEVYAMSEEMQKFLKETIYLEQAIILLKAKTKLETILAVTKFSKKEIYQIAKTNNLQVNEG